MEYKRLRGIILSNDFESLRYLMKGRDYDINRKYKGDNTALHYAIKQNCLEMAKFLLEHGADVNLPCKEYTCLHLAVKLGSVDLVKLILSHGVTDLNYIGGSIAPRYGIMTPLYDAILLHRLASAELLLQHGADANIGAPLYLAVQLENRRAIELLLSHGADPNCQDSYGNLAFHCRFVLEDPELRNLFLKHGADELARNRDGRSVLHIALLYADCDYVRHLLEAGLSVDERDIFNVLELRLSPDLIIPRLQLLIDYGADMNAVRSRQTPLYRLAWRGQIEVIECLLNAGAIIDYEGTDSPIRAAVPVGRIETVEYLIEKGARLDAPVQDQRTLINLAMTDIADDRTKWQMVQLLMENGLTVDENDCVDLSQGDREQLDACQREFDNMKEIKVCDDYSLTYQDLLVKRGNDLVRHLRNSEVRKKIELAEYKNLFPSFSSRMEANVCRGLAKMKLLDDVVEILQTILISVLPYDLIKMIVLYFKVEELEAFLAVST